MQDLYNNISNPRWRLNNLYYIVDKKSNLIKFNENSIQKRINDVDSNRKIILKARQFGVTTQESLKQLDAVLFRKNFTACVLAHEDDGIAKIFQKPRLAYDLMHASLKPEIARGGGSKYEMFFPKNNSRFYCDLESRGDTINWLHVSEAAFMDKERLNATLQAVPLDGIVTIETTANGLDNHFYELWTDELSPYKKLFYPWFFHDEYKLPFDGIYKPTEEEKEFINKVKRLYKHDITKEQIAFRRFKQSELKHVFTQEYPEDDTSCFIHSGRNVVDQELFTSLINETKPPIEVIESSVEIYHKRDLKKNYVIGADVAQGIGADYSTASVICIEDLEEVAFFRGKLSPYLFAKKLNAIAHFFSNAHKIPLLAVEINNHGHAVLLELKENILYRNLYHKEGKEDEPGWLSTSVTRPMMIDQLIESISSRYIKLNSKETLKEMRMLIEDRGKIQAPAGKNDDCVIAAGIAVQILIENLSRIKLYNNISKKILV